MSSKKIISTDNAPKSPLFSQAIQVGTSLILSGMVGMHVDKVELVSDDVAVQTDQALKHIGAVLGAAGLGYRHVVKVNVLLADMKYYAAMNEVYSKYFPDNPPTRAAYEVAALPLGAKVEIVAEASTL